MPKFYTIRLDAGHTPSGNPKRALLVYNEDGECVASVDEGYRGTGRWLLIDEGHVTADDEVIELAEFSVPHSEYKEALS